MIRCYITDRRRTPSLPESIARFLRAPLLPGDSVWLQIREKDLPARDLLHLARRAQALARSSAAKIIVNSRLDVALAAGASGLHLPADSLPAHRWRPLAPPGFLIGVSCHSLDEVRDAAASGADYVLFGPVFAPLSKPSALEPRGLDALRDAARAVAIPVLALGGITHDNSASCLAAGAAGIAAISMFQGC